MDTKKKWAEIKKQVQIQWNLVKSLQLLENQIEEAKNSVKDLDKFATNETKRAEKEKKRADEATEGVTTELRRNYMWVSIA